MRSECSAAVLLAFLSSFAWAEPNAPAKCPNEPPPIVCAHPTIPCFIPEKWPNAERTADEIATLFQTRQFCRLEKALDEVLSSEKRFKSGSRPAAGAYMAFQMILSTNNYSEGYAGVIEEWRSAYPKSIYVPFAQARQAYAAAWAVRGSHWASEVPKEAWELFALRLQESEKILLDAPPALKATTLWHHMLLTVTLDSDRLQSRPDQVFAEAVKRWPDYYAFYDLVISRLTPRWHGTWEQVDAFIDYWTRQQAAREGTSLYARLYMYLFGLGYSPQEVKADTRRMIASFADLTARYPDPGWKNVRASYACLSRDKQAFTDAIKGLPTGEVMPAVWLDGYSYDGCMRWAGI
jgi:hypothetical protein